MKKGHRPATEKITEKILNVWVQPRASRNGVLGFRDEYLRVRVTAPPNGGEANHLLREILAAALRISISRVEIVSGHRARRKRVRVIDVPPGNLEELGRNPAMKH